MLACRLHGLRQAELLTQHGHVLVVLSAAQVVKVFFPVYYGARYQCQKVPKHIFLKGMQHLDAERQQQQQRQHHHHVQTAHKAPSVVQCSACRPAAALHQRSCASEVAAAEQPAQMAPAVHPPLVM